MEEERASRIKLSKMPKVNKQLAEKLIESKSKKNVEVLGHLFTFNVSGPIRFFFLLQA